MPTAVIQNILITDAFPQHMVVLYRVNDAIPSGGDSSALIEITLPGMSTDGASYLQMPKRGSTGSAFVIQMISFQIACESADFTTRALNRNGIGLINTIYEAFKISNSNRVGTLGNLNDQIIRNRDNPMDNKLYVHISNAGAAISDIFIELVYYNIRSQVD